jgi:ubiquinone/menaquinone biosynthesis C-methylase UbiE
MTNQAQSFDQTAKTLFAPIYPVIARQIITWSGIRNGVCLDLGSGPAMLTISLAEITQAHIYALDNSIEASEIAKNNVATRGLAERITPITADVQELPFVDAFADLIISRGSIFFWEDTTLAFREMYRVLKPNGCGYIGGGFGTAELREQISLAMEQRDGKKWKHFVRKNQGTQQIECFKKSLRNAQIHNYDIRKDYSGLWILLKK